MKSQLWFLDMPNKSLLLLLLLYKLIKMFIFGNSENLSWIETILPSPLANI